MADDVVTVYSGGSVRHGGGISKLAAYEQLLAIEEGASAKEKQSGEGNLADASGGQLIVAEEVAKGYVSLDVLRLYVTNVGGIFTWTAIILGDTSHQALGAIQVFYLGLWARQYETHSVSDVAVWW